MNVPEFFGLRNREIIGYVSFKEAQPTGKASGGWFLIKLFAS